jgi:hypothetical protein
MKTFRYKKGHSAGSTMTVSELKEKLSGHPDSMPVMCTWEGVNAFVSPDEFEVKVVNKGFDDDAELCVVINVEGY